MDKIISKIVQLYSLNASVKCISKVRKGYLTSNFFIGDSKQKFFLKQYTDNEERIKKTHKAKKFFFRKGIPVIMPLKNKGGRTYCCLNDKCYALFPYVEGLQFKRLKMNKRALESAGITLAKIHQATKDKYPSIKLIRRNRAWDEKDSLNRLENIKSIITKKKEKTKSDKQASRLIEIKKNIIKNNKFKWNDFNLGKDHIIHGDFHEANLFFNKESKVKRVFDWECVSYAPRVMEIARVLRLMCFNGRFTKCNYRNASIFVEAYNKIYPISKKELSEGISMEYVKQAFCLWVLEEYYLKDNKKIYQFLDDQFMILKYMSKNAEKHIEAIICQNWGEE